MLNKNIIEQKFRKSLAQYNLNALIQKEIAEELINSLLTYSKTNFNNILEIGCGSGFLTEIICRTLSYKKLILNDITEISKNFTAKFSDKFITGDIEKIEIPNNLDLIISSSVFQWLENFNTFTEKIKYSLKKDGIFAFAMFTTDNFKEIREYFGFSLNYLTNNNIEKILEKNFKILSYRAEERVLNFDNPIEILDHIKKTGLTIGQNISKTQLSNFIKNSNNKLTYCYNFVIASRK